MGYVYVMSGGYSFKGFLGSNSCLSIHVCHQVYICIIGEMIYKYCGSYIPLNCGVSMMSWNEAICGAYQLIHADHFSGSS